MMVLDLKCANDHYFEGWFANTQTFYQQKEAGEIHCPVCENNQIIQMLSPVAIKRASGPSPEESEIPSPLEKLNRFYRYIEEHFEEVGSEFAKEALKIHYGVTEKRNIRGTSTEDEEEVLKEEGVDFIKFPFPKGDH
jgi:hypothetical protein